jgi:hypothetical protein
MMMMMDACVVGMMDVGWDPAYVLFIGGIFPFIFTLKKKGEASQLGRSRPSGRAAQRPALGERLMLQGRARAGSNGDERLRVGHARQRR